MNIAQSFANYLETITGSTLGQTLFIGQAPSSNKAPDDLWWIITSGGTPILDAVTGEMVKQYSIEVYHRSRNYKSVYDLQQDLEITLNCSRCVELQDFEIVSIRATAFPIDSDLDDEDRKIALIQVDLTAYEDCIDIS